MLDDSIVFAGGFDTLVALENVVAARLLDVNILARLAGPDSCQRMPVIGRSNGDSIDILVFQQLANIDVSAGLAVVSLLKCTALAVQDFPIDIAQGCNLYAIDILESTDVRAPPAVDAYHSHADNIVGAADAGKRRGQGQADPSDY
jgi:hypothetical protein